MDPKICAVIPSYDHGETLGTVIRGVAGHLPVIAVNDGSTDGTAEILAGETGVTVVAFEHNRGKGAALKAGFACAQEKGFTHAIVIDADGQHSPDDIPALVAACRQNPEALLVGTRPSLKDAGAPGSRRFANGLSNFWFRIETGIRLSDTQCGYRCYPLHAIEAIRVKSDGYAFELEILVKASWCGFQLAPVPVSVKYGSGTGKSHFRPFADFERVARTHTKLTALAFCLPTPVLGMLALGSLGKLSFRKRMRFVAAHLFAEHTDSAFKVSLSVAIGLFCGIAPIWGFQMAAAIMLAHLFKLNRAISATASNISFPLVAPFVLAGGLILGHYMLFGTTPDVSSGHIKEQLPGYFLAWVLGSFVLAATVAAAGFVISMIVYYFVRLARR